MQSLYTPFQPTLSTRGLADLGLDYKYSPACASLKGIVHSYLQITTDKPTPYPTIPDGTQAIFISVNGSIIGGSQYQAVDIQILEAGSYFGIWFYPAALRHFFDLDLSEITNQFADSKYFPSKKFVELHEKIYQYKAFQKRKLVCEQWLLEQFKPQGASQLDWALSIIYQSFGNVKISKIAETIGWSSRHLNRKFQRHIGLDTKAFTKIIRIQRVCRNLSLVSASSLDTALELGFFDQSHLIKDFNKLLRTTPSNFIKQYKSDFYNRRD